ncbi:MAG: AhpC/TSA family protein [Prevotellaceae bacterium]|nr:AhpC/TSA family protein [Prevotellaceae bacterium]
MTTKNCFTGKSPICFFSLALLILFTSCGKNAVIHGTIANADNELITLSLNTSPARIIDTVRLKSSGDFSFKYNFKKSIYPVYLLLSAKDKTLASLLLEPGDNVTLTTDLKNPKTYQISGSEGSLLLKELNDRTLAVSISMDSLVASLEKFNSTPQYETEMTKTNRELSNLFVRYKRDMIRFITKNNKSYASHTAIYLKLPNGLKIFGKEADAIYFKMLADSLEKKYPYSPYVYQLRDDYKTLSQANMLQNMIENAESSSYPDISLPDATGKKIALSSLKNKVILLNFWASTDKVSATNSIEFLPLYEKYHPQGFEIYHVSLDKNRETWLYTINNQKLPWINVCDFKGAESYAVTMYNVRKLPANYLIDSEGEIVDRDLFGDRLEEKIKTLLKNTTASQTEQ